MRSTGAGRLGAAALLGVLTAACSERPLGASTDGATTGGTTTTGVQTTAGADPTSGAPPASTSSGEQSSSGDPETGDAGCGFYGCPVDLGDAGRFECDTFAQDCVQTDKCVPFAQDGLGAFDSTRCVQIPDVTRPLGAPCTAEGGPASGIDDCEKGAVCLHVDPATLQGTCAALCQGPLDAPTCPEDQVCSEANFIGVCLPACDPLAAACPAGQVCTVLPSAPGFVCWPDASGAGGQALQPCAAAGGCDPGLICADDDAAAACNGDAPGCCTPFCAVGEPPDVCPDPAQQCLPFFADGEAPAGLEHVGLCFTP